MSIKTPARGMFTTYYLVKIQPYYPKKYYNICSRRGPDGVQIIDKIILYEKVNRLRTDLTFLLYNRCIVTYTLPICSCGPRC